MNIPSFRYERPYWAQGLTLVAGVDEVGVGAWAGPVCAGAVIFKPKKSLPASLYQGRGNIHLAYIPYNRKLREPAREHRLRPTPAEEKMWADVLKQGKLAQYQFLRQKPLENFIADFYCRKLLLVIEIDGDSHNRKGEYDTLRSEKLTEYNIQVVRYKNEDVMGNPTGVYQDLLIKIKQRQEELQNPLDKGGMGDWSEEGFLIRDSKTLSPAQRERAAIWIKDNALAWAVGEASVEEIYALNILQAAKLAMQRAIDSLHTQPDVLLVDGNPPSHKAPAFAKASADKSASEIRLLPSEYIIKGDQTSFSIAAASIVAKVHRDQIMRNLAEQYPGYGFENHKGYGSQEHQEALKTQGMCACHRRAYAPIRALA